MQVSKQVKQWILNAIQILVIISLTLNFLENPNQKTFQELEANTFNEFSNPQSQESPLNQQFQKVSLLNVIDGDTIKVLIHDQEETIRLIGIDTPETKQPNQEIECFGPEASEAIKQKINEHPLLIELDPSQGERDRYNRILAYVFTESPSINLNLWMIENGFAREYTYNTNYKYQDTFQKAEAQAIHDNLGLWSHCNN